VVRIYRRHLKSCKYTSERERRCKCPIHGEGFVRDERVKPHSLNLTSWEAAAKLVLTWEAAGTTKVIEKVTLAEAATRYIADCEARRLAPSTLKPIGILLDKLKTFAHANQLTSLDSIGVSELRKFRATWKTWNALVQVKNIERLRAFFRFCLQSKWITESPGTVD
jgi:hypothetical protein